MIRHGETSDWPMDLQVPTRLPMRLVIAVLVLCALPFPLGLLGVDFGVAAPADPGLTSLDAVHNALAGSFVHTLLEWSAFCTALACAVLSMVHYRLERDVVTPVIGMALFSAGAVDAVHTLAADRLIGTAGDASNMMAATWALSRLYNVGVMLVGAGIFLAWPRERERPEARFVWLTGGLFVLSALVVAQVVILSESLPRTYSPDAFFKHPGDVLPLALFILAGAIVLPRFQARYPGIFTEALLLSTTPQIAAQFHMAFGSSEPFDHHFIAAHLLKLTAYMVPFAGLCLDYIHRLQLVRLQSDELRRTLGELASLKVDLELILESSSDGICGLDERGHATFANPAAVRMLGRSASELSRRPFWELVQPRQASGIAEALGRGVHREDDAADFHRGHGSRFTAAYSATPITRDGVITGAVVTFRDVTRRRARERAEREHTAALARLNSELIRTNEELEQFAYVASHDLKAPLRAVGTLAGWIEEDLTEGNREAVDQHLGLMRGRVKRMENLLADLLRFARIGRDDPELRQVDTGALVRDLAELIDPPPHIAVEVAPDMPVVYTATAPLEHIFLNLMTNAIKHHDAVAGNIVISCEDDPESERVRFRVTDDGPGIPEAYREKVFRVFQTLKPRDEVESTGMGLAIVKKIITSTGGEIHVEDAIPRGASFVFTWPRHWQLKTVEQTLSELPGFYGGDDGLL